MPRTPKIAYHMPDGSCTRSAARHSQAYRRLARPIEKATGAKLYSFDPDLAFRRRDGTTFTIPADVAEAIEAWVEAIECE